MALADFPSPATNGQVYTVNGVTYTYDGTKWTTTGVSPTHVLKAGDTMTGDLTVPSLNGGPLAGLRNVLINGNLRCNQRGVTIAAAAVGQYGPDRWKKVDATHMTQIVEDVNFVSGATYTLSWKGGTPQQLTAPATGHWTLPSIPITATEVQLELGAVATPFEQISYALEILLCQRYFQSFSLQAMITGYAGAANQPMQSLTFVFPVFMRANPNVLITNSNGVNVGNLVVHAVTTGFSQTAIIGNPGYAFYEYVLHNADAEL